MFSTLTDIDNSKTKKRRCSKAVTKHSELYSSIFYRLRVIKLKLKQIKIKVMTSKNLKLWRKKRQDYVPWYYIPSDTLRLWFTHRTIKFLTYDVLNARKKIKNLMNCIRWCDATNYYYFFWNERIVAIIHHCGLLIFNGSRCVSVCEFLLKPS